ncbi:leucine-rich_repeat domain-containing protein [Hexamita inflata]|uniref:Leucine-rich repeat domain-containing protein n=1 Tax=Hexamita inflata TaxID=28002 RepID=A0AA86Q676_9EUKA|nr:leucine-rich repeat domain-containing protein [Hexamita inflata]
MFLLTCFLVVQYVQNSKNWLTRYPFQNQPLLKIEIPDTCANKGIDLNPLCKVNNLTKLSIQNCALKNTDQISLLINLEELDLSANGGLKINSLYKIQGLTRLQLRGCDLNSIDQIMLLTNLEVLDISWNKLQNIDSISQLVNIKELNVSINKNLDISPLKSLVGLVKLNIQQCGLTQLSALKPLVNLQILQLNQNPYINIAELQYLNNLTFLDLSCCHLVSIYVLRPLVNLENLLIAFNNTVYLDANLIDMKQLQMLRVDGNGISDFTSIEKHKNFNNLNQFGERSFDISNQKNPMKTEATQLRRVEYPNNYLKENQNKRKIFKTRFDTLKLEIKAIINNANHIQFTSSVVQLFEQLNQAVSQ